MGARAVSRVWQVMVAKQKHDIGRVLGERRKSPDVTRENALLRAEVARLKIAMAAQREEIEALQTHAVQDALLPVLNRRGFFAEIARAMSFCARYRMPAALIYCDLNRFKQVNDDHGHDAGDQVLRHAVDVLLSGIRRSDILGRLGGDEFGILLWNADHAAADQKAHALKAELEANPCLNDAGPLPVSMSMGVAEVFPGEVPEQLVARADAAMYADKKASRTQKPKVAG